MWYRYRLEVRMDSINRLKVQLLSE
jgi:hypothetical protein